MIWLKYTGAIPAKSNMYVIVSRWANGAKRATLKKADDIVDFEERLGALASSLNERLGGIPYPDERIELWVFWHRHVNDGKRRDLSNIMKATEDALNKKLWNDDSQVSRIEQQMLYDATDSEWIELVIQPDPAQPRSTKRRGRTSSNVKPVT
jgi:hypothetical protein